MCKVVYRLFFISIILINFQAFSQKFEIISNKQGFNQNTINHIQQDKYGFLWFATPNGLIRYDGYDFKTFTTQSNTNGNISSNYITYLFNDNNGLLWIGTRVGLNVYVPSLEKFFDVKLSTPILVKKIKQDSNGDIWFSGNHSLQKMNVVDVKNEIFEASINLLNLEKLSDNLIINTFEIGDDSAIILGTNEGLKKLNYSLENNNLKITVTTFNDFYDFYDKTINTIEKKNAIFWIGTNKGLYTANLKDQKSFVLKKITDEKINFDVDINCISSDVNNNLWIGTKYNGIFKYNPSLNTLQVYNYNPKNKNGISSERINAIYQDEFNVLWIGTAQGGISKLDLSQKNFETYSNNPFDKSSLSDNLITAILEDTNGTIWIAGYNKKLSIAKKNSLENPSNLEFTNIEEQININKTDVIRSIFEDSYGYIWFGTDEGIYIYHSAQQKFYALNLKGGDVSNFGFIRVIKQINENEVLVAGNKVLIISNPWKNFSKNSFLAEIKNQINLEGNATCFVKNDSIFWIGTNNGLYQCKYTKKSMEVQNIFTNNSEKFSLSNSNVFSLHLSKNNLFIGTFGGGLNKMTLSKNGKPTEINYIREKEILPDNAIYGILPENDNILWISTDMGLFKYNITENNSKLFDVRDGLPQNNFRQNAFYFGKSGYMYFGGLNGLTIFNPESITINNKPPNVLITSLMVNNAPLERGTVLNDKIVLKKSITEADSIAICESQRIISFDVVAEQTSAPNKNKIAYKLEGLNEDWVTVDNGKTTITYTNLASKNYELKIKAANRDGIWSNNIKTLHIKITPLWYKTWWSYTILVLLIIASITSIMYYFLRNEKLKQKLIFEQLDKDRIETINQGKFEYFTNLSHEFRTPLTLIAGPLEKVIENNDNPNNAKFLEIVKKNTNRLLSLVDQLITFRQAEQGFVKLNYTKLTLSEFLYPTTEAFENYANERNINFFYKINSPNEEIIIDVEKFERILFNLLSNSFKNTPKQGSISIIANIKNKNDKKIIKIQVVDTGKGIPKENLENIFERFYQLGNKKGQVSGGGIGLAFCKSLIDLFEGKIKVKSTPNKQTKFTVFVPSKESDAVELLKKQKSFVKNWIPITASTEQMLIEDNNSLNQKRNILVIENELDIQNFLKTSLSNHYNITLANNGLEGLELVRQAEFSAIVSDVMMPEMDGFEFCKTIKSNPETCNIPVILLTALEDEGNLIKGLEFGADEYISKPFSLKHLELKLQKLITNSEQIKNYFATNSKPPKDKKHIKMSEKDISFLEDIANIIECNISNSNFGVEELAKEMGVSSSHFYRKLKQLTGQIPNAYLRNYRLQKAAELLASNKGYNVAEVMYQIGIESNSYFSTSFKKLHGVTPSEYLKNL